MMGPNEDAAVAMGRREIYVCFPCWLEKGLHVLTEGDHGRELPCPERDAAIARAQGSR